MESMRRSLGHALNRQLSAGFLSWREMAEERAEFMRHLRKGAAFLVNRGLALGFGGWKHCVSLAHSQDKKQAAMKRAMSYFLNKELSRGWGRMASDVGGEGGVPSQATQRPWQNG